MNAFNISRTRFCQETVTVEPNQVDHSLEFNLVLLIKSMHYIIIY